MSIKTEFSGNHVAKSLAKLGELSEERLSDYLTFASRYASNDHLESIVELAEERFAADAGFQEELVRSIHDGLQQRGTEIPVALRRWAERLARHYLGIDADTQTLPDARTVIGWRYLAADRRPKQANPWKASTKRRSIDGTTGFLVAQQFFRRGNQKSGPTEAMSSRCQKRSASTLQVTMVTRTSLFKNRISFGFVMRSHMMS